MSTVQKEIQKKLQIERQLLSVQLKKKNEQELDEIASTVEVQMQSKITIRLASIERALNRLEKGTFGVCQSCGQQIDGERLIALPYAEQCIDCQRELERKTIRLYVYA